MSVICAVKFADGVVTRMTVFDYSGDSLDVGRALILACAAYESRTGHPPPLIKEPERIAGYADILGFQYKTADGKVFTTTAAEYKRMLLFARIFDFKPDTPSNGASRTRAATAADESARQCARWWNGRNATAAGIYASSPEQSQRYGARY